MLYSVSSALCFDSCQHQFDHHTNPRWQLRKVWEAQQPPNGTTEIVASSRLLNSSAYESLHPSPVNSLPNDHVQWPPPIYFPRLHLPIAHLNRQLSLTPVLLPSSGFSSPMITPLLPCPHAPPSPVCNDNPLLMNTVGSRLMHACHPYLQPRRWTAPPLSPPLG